MGKYIKTKSKTSSVEVSLMELHSLGGVLTRAKTLALKKSAGVGSYIQLRSRRLVKPISTKKQNERNRCVVQTNPRVVNRSTLKAEKLGDKKEEVFQENVNLGVSDEEGSFGENILEVEGTGRTTRETTPCNLIRDPDDINIPGSSTKSSRPTEPKYRVQNTTPRHIPSTSEMDEFFTTPEKQQQRLFIEKYNFDPVNDKPIPGRYEWAKLDATKKT